MKRSAKLSPREKFCVYDSRIVPYLLRYSRRATKAILKAQKKYPNVIFGAVITNVAHLAATVATNAALGKPLKRMWVADAARRLKGGGR